MGLSVLETSPASRNRRHRINWTTVPAFNQSQHSTVWIDIRFSGVVQEFSAYLGQDEVWWTSARYWARKLCVFIVSYNSIVYSNKLHKQQCRFQLIIGRCTHRACWSLPKGTFYVSILQLASSSETTFLKNLDPPLGLQLFYNRLESIMLQNLPIMLLSISPISAYYAFMLFRYALCFCICHLFPYKMLFLGLLTIT